jgi:hypothetical protein
VVQHPGRAEEGDLDEALIGKDVMTPTRDANLGSSMWQSGVK